MPAHTAVVATIVAALAALFALLSDSRTRRDRLKVFVTGAAFLATLIGLGALFGQTLGDFLRGR